MDIEDITKEDVAAAVAKEGWVKELAEKHCSGIGLSMDEIFKFNIQFVSKHWHLQPSDVDYFLSERILNIIHKL